MSKPDIAYAMRLPPAEAVRYFESKGLKLTGSWNEVWQEAHSKAFTVAHVSKLDILADIYDAVSAAIKEGTTAREFVKVLGETLQRKGWWGQAVDKATGEITETYPGSGKPVEYGSPARLKLIYQQNLQTAYMTGRYQTMKAGAGAVPYWQYVAVNDSRTRPSHAALNGRVYRHDDPIWNSLYPPNGWNCRCRISPLTQRQVDRKGLTVEDSGDRLITRRVPAGKHPDGQPKYADVTGIKTGMTDDNGEEIIMLPDAGWSYNPGAAWADNLKTLAEEKASGLRSKMPASAFSKLKDIFRHGGKGGNL